jgi:hypothetical protein
MQRNIKIMLFWIIGALLLLVGSMIAGRVERGLGVSDAGFFFAVLVAFAMFLLGGLLWMSVGMATKAASEEE